MLSANERRYLRALQPITVAFDADWAPFSYVDSDGRARGIAAAYLAYLSNALGVTFDRRAYADSSAVSRAFVSWRRPAAFLPRAPITSLFPSPSVRIASASDIAAFIGSK